VKTTKDTTLSSNRSTTTSRASKLSRIGITLTVTAFFLCSLAVSTSAQTLVPGPALVQISAGSTQVWGLDGFGNVYQYDKKSNTFNQEHGALSQIAVGKGNSVWGLNASGAVYAYDFKTKEWVNIPTPGTTFNQIAVGGAGVWGIDSYENVWYFDGTFVQITSGSPLAAVIAVGADEPWIIDPGLGVWVYNVDTGYFDQIKFAQLQQIAVGSALEAWGVNPSQQIWEYDVKTEQFEEVNGLLVQVSLTNKANIWGINASGAAYKFVKGKFVQQGTLTGFVQISVGPPAVGAWAITSTGAIYKF
jgi:virginiamycin B lyase